MKNFLLKHVGFLYVCALYFFPALLAGVSCGVLYDNQLIGDTGRWVDTLSWIADMTLHVSGFAVEILVGLYILVWALFGKMPRVKIWVMWLIIKCILGLTLVPVFAIGAGFFIAALSPLYEISLQLTIICYVLSAVLYLLLGDALGS
jgi:hypothetical protein